MTGGERGFSLRQTLRVGLLVQVRCLSIELLWPCVSKLALTGAKRGAASTQGSVSALLYRQPAICSTAAGLCRGVVPPIEVSGGWECTAVPEC